MAIWKIKLGGIYIIQHTSGSFYIGKSVDILSNRWSTHYSQLVMGNHHSPELQNCFDNSKIENFTFQILEYVSKTYVREQSGLRGKALDKLYNRILLTIEKNWMNRYDIKDALNKDKKNFKNYQKKK